MGYDEEYNNRKVIRTKLLWIVILSLILVLILIIGFIADAVFDMAEEQSYRPTPEPTKLTGREVTPTPYSDYNPDDELIPTETPTPTPYVTDEPDTPTPTDEPIASPTEAVTPTVTATPEPTPSPIPTEAGSQGFIPISELFPNLSTYYKKDQVTGVELELILQKPELPHGCESVALTMVLNYYGFKLGKTDIADKYLIYGDNFVTSYEGNPYGEEGGLIYAPGLTDTANEFLTDRGSTLKAYDVSGGEFFDLIKTYINHDIPVILFATRDYIPVEFRSEAREYDGKTWKRVKSMHCVVMSGYDEEDDTVIIYDSLKGVLKVKRATIEEIYNNFYRMAVVVK